MNKKSGIGWILVILIVSPFIAYGLGGFQPYYNSFIVTSGSMEPEIQTGALLYTIDVSPEDVMVGDTITYSSGSEEGFTTHEVIEKNSSSNQITFRTQGIANDSPDPGIVNSDQLEGKKLFSIPFLGYLITWAGTRTGMMATILVPGLLILLVESRKIYSEIQTKRTG